MNDMADRYRANTPTIAAEEIDGEVVVVSFESGHYYSLRDTAADIWRLLDAGCTVESVLESFVSNGNAREPAVLEFIAELRSERLMVSAGADDDVPRHGIEVGPFSQPTLERFEEMSQMLLYDPIHDVDETGWPNLPHGAGEQP